MIEVVVLLCLLLLWEMGRYRRNARERGRVAAPPLRDALTNLPNATLFADRMGQGIQRARRDKGKLAIVLVELQADQLANPLTRELNEGMLIEGANRMKATLRASDTLARVGDSLAAALEAPDLSSIECVLGRIHAAFEADMLLRGAQDVRASVNVATAVYPDGGADAESLMRLVGASRRAQRPPASVAGTAPAPRTTETTPGGLTAPVGRANRVASN